MVDIPCFPSPLSITATENKAVSLSCTFCNCWGLTKSKVGELNLGNTANASCHAWSLYQSLGDTTRTLTETVEMKVMWSSASS